MSLLSNSELRRLETKYAAGITSAAVVKIFKAKGERFSEATLRKYVQLGLLPTSRRVGIRGRHRGSSGLYPATTVRLANEIKKALESGATLDDMRVSTIGLLGEMQILRRSVDLLLDRIQSVMQEQDAPSAPALKQLLGRHRKGLEREVKALEQFVGRLGRQLKRAVA